MGIKKIDNLKNDIQKQIENSTIYQDDKTQDDLNTTKNSSIPPIRISETHKKLLENHFTKEKGLSLSSGIRMIIYEYLKKNNLM